MLMGLCHSTKRCCVFRKGMKFWNSVKINISFREIDFLNYNFFNDFGTFRIMYDRNQRKRIILCHGSRQNTVSSEIIILKISYFSSWNSPKSNDFLNYYVFLWSKVVLFVVVCKGVFYFWTVRRHLFSKRFRITELFIFIKKYDFS